MNRIPLKSGAEYDALTTSTSRRRYCYLQKAGATMSIKRQYRRRERRVAKRKIRKEASDD